MTPQTALLTTNMKYTQVSLKLAVAISLAILFLVGLLTPSITNAQTSTPSATTVTPTIAVTKAVDISDQIKEKVQELKASPKPMAYVGTITDKTDTTISIDTKAGTRQVSIGTATVILDQKSTRKTIAFDDLAIGDFVIAMGRTEPDNKSLSGKRILIINKPKAVSKTAIYGKVTEIDKTTFKFESPKAGEYSVKVTSKTRFLKTGIDSKDLTITNLDIASKVLVAGVLTADKQIEARLVVLE